MVSTSDGSSFTSTGNGMVKRRRMAQMNELFGKKLIVQIKKAGLRVKGKLIELLEALDFKYLLPFDEHHDGHHCYKYCGSYYKHYQLI